MPGSYSVGAKNLELEAAAPHFFGIPHVPIVALGPLQHLGLNILQADMHQKTGISRAQPLDRLEIARFQMSGIQPLFHGLEDIGVGYDHPGSHLLQMAPAQGSRLNCDPGRLPILHQDAPYRRIEQDVPTPGFKATGQFVGKGLGAALWIVVAQKVRQPQHGVEDEGSAPRRRPPVGAVGHQQQFELGVEEVAIEHLPDGQRD